VEAKRDDFEDENDEARVLREDKVDMLLLLLILELDLLLGSVKASQEAMMQMNTAARRVNSFVMEEGEKNIVNPRTFWLYV
jgi:hypothetical protein